MVADEFEGVAALDQADALIDQSLELDRLDLGAVLLSLRPALGLLVQVELALDAVELAVEQVDERPQQIGEIVLEAGAGQYRAKGLDYSVELGLHGIGFGQWPRIGFVLAGAIAVEGQFVEQMRGRRGGGKFGIGVGEGKGAVVACHGGCLSAGGSAGADRGLYGDPLVGGADGLHPWGTEQSGGWRRAAILLGDAKPPPSTGVLIATARWGWGRRRKIVGRRHCNPASPPANRRSGRPHARLFCG